VAGDEKHVYRMVGSTASSTAQGGTPTGIKVGDAFSEVVDKRSRPSAQIICPDASYREMTEWALARCRADLEYGGIVQSDTKTPDSGWPQIAPNSFKRGFMAEIFPREKYPKQRNVLRGTGSKVSEPDAGAVGGRRGAVESPDLLLGRRQARAVTRAVQLGP